MDIKSLTENTHSKDVIVIIQNLKSKSEVKMTSSRISDLRINFDALFSITGELTFVDLYKIEDELQLNNNLRIIIFYNDILGNSFKRYYKVTKIQKTRRDNKEIITLLFRDIISYEFSKTIIPFSFKECTLDEVFKYYFEKLEEIYKENIELKLKKTNILQNFSIPNNTNFLEFISKECIKNGYILYQDRNSINLIQYKKLLDFSFENNEKIYKDKCENRLYQYKILEYFTNNKSKDNIKTKSQSHFYNPDSKSFEINIDQNNDKMNISYENDENQESNGIIYKTRLYSQNSEEKLKNILDTINNSELTIYIPGDLKNTDKFRVFNVEIAGNPNFNDNYNEKLSGKYLCTRFSDKLVNSMFLLSEVHLSRFNDSFSK